VTELIDAQAQPEAGVTDLASRFPPGFVFGVASSAYQIEGAVDEDGRGPSIWDTFTHQSGRTANGETGDVACDHYHRWAEDLDLMRGLGVDAYRFSVSWPRVLPEGAGHVNVRGLAFYDRLVDALLERHIDPVLTLYHWDLPQALQERGGWASPAAAEWFADYAAVLADRLGDRVRTWVTINEPQVFAFTGHGRGRHAPGIAHWPTALRVADSALAAHAAASARIRSAVPGARIGVALDLNRVEPATDSEADEQAALRHRALQQDWFLDPLFGRGYPQIALQAHARAGHLDGLELAPPAHGALDFIGLNYYTRELVSADEDAPFGLRVTGADGMPRTTMGWEIHPDGLRQVLRWLHETYAPPAIIVTENGAAFTEADPLNGQAVEDAERRAYLTDHVAAAARALAEGVPLTGYFAWSLLDNFEWEKGYGQRFGIVRVDYPTLRRSLKASGAWYGSLLAARNGRGAAPPG
jgi:beta-glucosidase